MRGRDQRCPERSKKKVSGTCGTMGRGTYELFALVEGERSALAGHVGSAGTLPRRGTSR